MKYLLKTSLRRLAFVIGIDVSKMRRFALTVFAPKLPTNSTLKQIARLHEHCLAVNFSSNDDADRVEAAYERLVDLGEDEARINLAVFRLQRDQDNAASVVPLIKEAHSNRPNDLHCASVLATAYTFSNSYEESASIVKQMIVAEQQMNNPIFVTKSNKDDDFAVVKQVAEELEQVYMTQPQQDGVGVVRELHSGSQEYWSMRQVFDRHVSVTPEIANTLLFQTQFTGLPLPFVLANLSDENNRRELVQIFKTLTEGLPEQLIINPPRIFSEIGIIIDGRLINWATLKDQDHLTELFNHGIYDYLTNLNSPLSLLEIGSGYGGVALHLSKTLKPSRHLLVDLPPTLGFAASYLRGAMADEANRVTFYDGTDKTVLNDAAVALIPNFLADDIRGPIEFAVNTGSFGEMTQEQVVFYISLIDRVLSDRGVVYEHNDATAHERFEIRPLIDKYFRGTVINVDRNERIWCRPGVKEILAKYAAGRPKTSFSRSATVGTGFPFPVLH